MEVQEQQNKSRVVRVDSVESWEFYVNQATNQGCPIVVHFTASWCMPSVAMNPFFEELASAFQDVLFLTVDVDGIKPRSTQDEAHSSRPIAQATTGPAARRKAGPGMLAWPPSFSLSCGAHRHASIFFPACSPREAPSPTALAISFFPLLAPSLLLAAWPHTLFPSFPLGPQAYWPFFFSCFPFASPRHAVFHFVFLHAGVWSAAVAFPTQGSHAEAVCLPYPAGPRLTPGDLSHVVFNSYVLIFKIKRHGMSVIGELYMPT